MGALMFHVDGKTDGRTDRYDDVNSRFSQFCERAYNSQSHDIKNNPIRHPLTQLYITVLGDDLTDYTDLQNNTYFNYQNINTLS
jgi:hypothetical protein